MNTTLLVLATCWITVSGFCTGNEQVESLPTSVHYSFSADREHVVTIAGVAAAQPKIGESHAPLAFSQRPLDYIPSIPERVSFMVDHDKRTCTLVTSRQLNRSELSAAIDQTAKARSDIPCWAELVARDFKQSTEFSKDRYVSTKLDGDAPSGLAWHLLPGSVGLSIPFLPFVEQFGQAGRFLIVPLPVPMGSLRVYKIYILDHNDEILWSDDSTVFGGALIAIGDSNGDYRHEIYAKSSNPEDGTIIFHIKPNSK